MKSIRTPLERDVKALQRQLQLVFENLKSHQLGEQPGGGFFIYKEHHPGHGSTSEICLHSVEGRGLGSD